ncbi:MAG: hypothetical protein IPL56_16535 [Saprospiraceae bacterium]|nr:hypothetical protein [Saprospiraceae bacterium]
MSEWINFICFNCKHYHPVLGCEAFEDGDIPFEITNTNEHATVLPGQKNNFVFEAVEDEVEGGKAPTPIDPRRVIPDHVDFDNPLGGHYGTLYFTENPLIWKFDFGRARGGRPEDKD